MGTFVRRTRNQPRRLRHDRFIKEYEHDTYKLRGKLSEPTVCLECGAVYHKGRWQWRTRPEGAQETLCPACQRERDRYPGGYVRLSGPYWQQHHDEILNLVRHVEAREKQNHPLRRILAFDAQGEDTVVTTTTLGLARALGDAVHRACKGELCYQYSDEADILHVTWRR